MPLFPIVARAAAAALSGILTLGVAGTAAANAAPALPTSLWPSASLSPTPLPMGHFSGRFQAGRLPAGVRAAGLVGSSNWAGIIGGLSADASGRAVRAGREYTGVSGAWDVPGLLPDEQGVEGSWIGLGGVVPGDGLLQIGTIEGWDGSAPTYWAFWELVTPDGGGVPAQPIAPVQPGDIVAASIAPASWGGWTLAITDNGRPLPITAPAGVRLPGLVQSGTTVQVPFTPTATAEWIVEDPSCGQPAPGDPQLCPFADFVPEQFLSAEAEPADGSGNASALANPWVASVILAPDGAPLAVPTRPITDDSFGVDRLIGGRPSAPPAIALPVN